MAIYSKLIEGLNNGDETFVKVFTVNPNGRINNRVDLPFASCVPMEGIMLSALAEGDIVMLSENGVSTPFYLAKHNYESGLNGTGRNLFVRKDYYPTKKAWSTGAYENKYAISTIDQFLNNDYLSLLDNKIVELINKTKFYYTVGHDNWTVTSLERAVFLLSATEFGLSASYANVEGSALSISDKLRVSTATTTSTHQHTRSPATNDLYSTCCVLNTGRIAGMVITYADMVFRPAFTLPANILVSPERNADGSYNLIV